LLLTQFQLLWMAVFHWNENLLPGVAVCTLAVQDGSSHTPPASHSKSPCVVCQIVRQNAVRPGVGVAMPQPFSAVYFHPLAASQGIHSYQPHVANGRAPPLS
jgi:hypothetical protein